MHYSRLKSNDVSDYAHVRVNQWPVGSPCFPISQFVIKSLRTRLYDDFDCFTTRQSEWNLLRTIVAQVSGVVSYAGSRRGLNPHLSTLHTTQHVVWWRQLRLVQAVRLPRLETYRRRIQPGALIRHSSNYRPVSVIHCLFNLLKNNV